MDPYAHGVEYFFNSFLRRLVGYRLYSVEFALDYVQFHFDVFPTADMPMLTCEVNPVVTRRGKDVAPGEHGWADTLVALAGQTVTATYESARAGVRIDLEDGSILLRPTADDLVGPEIAMLNNFEDRQWMCWRPGEEAFEYLAGDGVGTA